MADDIKFKLTADAMFYAKDIDDAFAILAEHFTNMAKTGLDKPSIFVDGNCEIRPIETKGTQPMANEYVNDNIAQHEKAQKVGYPGIYWRRTRFGPESSDFFYDVFVDGEIVYITTNYRDACLFVAQIKNEKS